MNKKERDVLLSFPEKRKKNQERKANTGAILAPEVEIKNLQASSPLFYGARIAPIAAFLLFGTFSSFREKKKKYIPPHITLTFSEESGIL